MADKYWENYLDGEATVKVTQRLITDKGEVQQFVVQLLKLVEGHWRVVLRYDAWHGFPHRDRLHLDRNQKPRKEPLDLTNADAFTYAIEDIWSQWEIYVERFLRGDYP